VILRFLVLPLLGALFSVSSFADANFLRIALVGDVVPGSVAEKFKFVPPTPQQITDFNSATDGSDFVIGNFEGTLCDRGTAKKCEWQHPCYAFRLPESEASLLAKLGFRMLSVANNHTLDFESNCRDRTVSALSDSGVITSGLPGQVARLKVKGVRVSMIAFHASAYFNSTLNLLKASRLIRSERKNADLLIIYFHGGAEGTGAVGIPFKPEIYVGENRGDVVKFARTAIRSGADLVYGSGPHVVRGCEIYRGKLISYSVGDQIFGVDRTGESFEREGLVLQVDWNSKTRELTHRFRSTVLGPTGWPTIDPEGRALANLRTRSQVAFKSSACAIAN
jgi:hypothetical protein